MKQYTVYFELFGKKMKTTVAANSEEDAKYLIMGKIIWHKVESEPANINDDPIEFLKQTFGIK